MTAIDGRSVNWKRKKKKLLCMKRKKAAKRKKEKRRKKSKSKSNIAFISKDYYPNHLISRRSVDGNFSAIEWEISVTQRKCDEMSHSSSLDLILNSWDTASAFEFIDPKRRVSNGSLTFTLITLSALWTLFFNISQLSYPICIREISWLWCEAESYFSLNLEMTKH